ncbi:hypothetical protein BT96DRAFT_940732 [Gymnopus androsaceus JB14]|uniref:Uncharacterized protein n=1 Tax=Gymnopus androsaceus JB14 TaxID=1447944 RepID=A0A6A4HJU2_9AGAR|nr:hypothetical protein BT96DRAFT_940732 [Gymnopus androsaceus JB14]
MTMALLHFHLSLLVSFRHRQFALWFCARNLGTNTASIVASNDSSNVEAACAVQGAERVEVESIAKLASTKVAIYRYVSVARPTPFILQGRVIANWLQMTGEILAKVRITSTLLQHYQYRMQCWVLTKVDSVLLLEDGLKLDGAPVIFLKALTELTDLEEFDDILALAKQSSDLLMQPASLGNWPASPPPSSQVHVKQEPLSPPPLKQKTWPKDFYFCDITPVFQALLDPKSKFLNVKGLFMEKFKGVVFRDSTFYNHFNNMKMLLRNFKIGWPKLAIC